MATVTTDPYSGRTTRVEIGAGETSPWLFVGPECTVVGQPGDGGTVMAEATYSLPDVVAADNKNGTSHAIPIPWPAGSVTSVTAADVSHATAIRFTATGAAGVGEIAS